MALCSAVVFLVEWAIKILHQCLFPGRVPVVSYLSQEALPRLASRSNPSLLSNFCLCAGTKSVLDFACAPREWSLCSYRPPAVLCASPTGFPSQPSRGSFSQRRAPGWEVQCGPQTPQALRRTSPWIPLSFWSWIACLGLWVLSMKCLCPTYLSYGSFFISKVTGNLFCIIDSCSVYSCNFGIPLGED